MSEETKVIHGRHSLNKELDEAANIYDLAGNALSRSKKLKHRFSIFLPAHRLSLLFAQWDHNRRTRKQLAEMPDYLLKDIGLDRGLVEQELHKPFWKD